jgi:serine/threonine protein kinase
VLELVRGVDLRRLQRRLVDERKKPPIEAIAAIGRAIGRALGAAGRALPGGLVHRDVSPHNVLLSIEGEIKLADFGVTRALGRERWTASGHLKGKCAYMAPESVRGGTLSEKADVFSLGVTLFELCAGRRPFQARSFLDQVDALMNGERPRLGDLAPHVPLQVVELVEQMLAADPVDRPTPDEVTRRFGRATDEVLETKWLRDAVQSTRGPSVTRVRRSVAIEARNETTPVRVVANGESNATRVASSKP